MTADATSHSDTINFIERWASSGAAERANYQIFLTELCNVLEVPRPEPTKQDEDENAYVFEKAVTFHHGDGTNSTGRIDLYKRGCFVLKAKQGSEQNNQPQPELTARTKRTRRRGTAVRGTQSWNEVMMGARGQAGKSWLCFNDTTLFWRSTPLTWGCIPSEGLQNSKTTRQTSCSGRPGRIIR